MEQSGRTLASRLTGFLSDLAEKLQTDKALHFGTQQVPYLEYTAENRLNSMLAGLPMALLFLALVV